jgi:hypothetical protein
MKCSCTFVVNKMAGLLFLFSFLFLSLSLVHGTTCLRRSMLMQANKRMQGQGIRASCDSMLCNLTERATSPSTRLTPVNAQQGLQLPLDKELRAAIWRLALAERVWSLEFECLLLLD